MKKPKRPYLAHEVAKLCGVAKRRGTDYFTKEELIAMYTNLNMFLAERKKNNVDKKS